MISGGTIFIKGEIYLLKSDLESGMPNGGGEKGCRRQGRGWLWIGWRTGELGGGRIAEDLAGLAPEVFPDAKPCLGR